MSTPENRAAPGAPSHATSSQRFEDFIGEAVGANLAWLEERDINGAEWAHCIWHFVRLCRFHPDLEMLKAPEAADLVEEGLRGFLGPGHDDPWGVFEDGYSEPSRDAFIDQWHKVRRPVELDDPLAEAARLADKVCELIPSSAKVESPSRATYRRFISIAGHLQALLGPEQTIALPVKLLAEILGVTRQRVGQIRRNAVREGYLSEVADYTPPGKSPGLAATYHFDLSLFPYFRRG